MYYATSSGGGEDSHELLGGFRRSYVISYDE